MFSLKIIVKNRKMFRSFLNISSSLTYILICVPFVYIIFKCKVEDCFHFYEELLKKYYNYFTLKRKHIEMTHFDTKFIGETVLEDIFL